MATGPRLAIGESNRRVIRAAVVGGVRASRAGRRRAPLAVDRLARVALRTRCRPASRERIQALATSRWAVVDRSSWRQLGAVTGGKAADEARAVIGGSFRVGGPG